jgi:hypothetical protein
LIDALPYILSTAAATTTTTTARHNSTRALSVITPLRVMRDDPQAVAAVRVLTDVPLHNCARPLCFAFLLCAVLFFQKKKNTSLFFFSLFFIFI